MIGVGSLVVAEGVICNVTHIENGDRLTFVKCTPRKFANISREYEISDVREIKNCCRNCKYAVCNENANGILCSKFYDVIDEKINCKEFIHKKDDYKEE